MVRTISTREDVAKLRSDGRLVVIDFYAVWCGPCVQFKPHFENLEKRFPNVLFAKVDVENSVLAQDFHIQSMPTFKLLVGDREVASMSGADLAGLQALIEKHQFEVQKVFYPKSVASLKKKLKELNIDYSSAVEKNDLIELYVNHLGNKEMKELLADASVPTKSFVEKSDYRDACTSVITESMKKK